MYTDVGRASKLMPNQCSYVLSARGFSARPAPLVPGRTLPTTRFKDNHKDEATSSKESKLKGRRGAGDHNARLPPDLPPTPTESAGVTQPTEPGQVFLTPEQAAAATGKDPLEANAHPIPINPVENLVHGGPNAVPIPAPNNAHTPHSPSSMLASARGVGPVPQTLQQGPAHATPFGAPIPSRRQGEQQGAQHHKEGPAGAGAQTDKEGKDRHGALINHDNQSHVPATAAIEHAKMQDPSALVPPGTAVLKGGLKGTQQGGEKRHGSPIEEAIASAQRAVQAREEPPQQQQQQQRGDARSAHEEAPPQQQQQQRGGARSAREGAPPHQQQQQRSSTRSAPVQAERYARERAEVVRAEDHMREAQHAEAERIAAAREAAAKQGARVGEQARAEIAEAVQRAREGELQQQQVHQAAEQYHQGKAAAQEQWAQLHEEDKAKQQERERLQAARAERERHEDAEHEQRKAARAEERQHEREQWQREVEEQREQVQEAAVQWEREKEETQQQWEALKEEDRLRQQEREQLQAARAERYRQADEEHLARKAARAEQQRVAREQELQQQHAAADEYFKEKDRLREQWATLREQDRLRQQEKEQLKEQRRAQERQADEEHAHRKAAGAQARQQQQAEQAQREKEAAGQYFDAKAAVDRDWEALKEEDRVKQQEREREQAARAERERQEDEEYERRKAERAEARQQEREAIAQQQQEAEERGQRAAAEQFVEGKAAAEERWGALWEEDKVKQQERERLQAARDEQERQEDEEHLQRKAARAKQREVERDLREREEAADAEEARVAKELAQLGSNAQRHKGRVEEGMAQMAEASAKRAEAEKQAQQQQQALRAQAQQHHTSRAHGSAQQQKVAGHQHGMAEGSMQQQIAAAIAESARHHRPSERYPVAVQAKDDEGWGTPEEVQRERAARLAAQHDVGADEEGAQEEQGPQAVANKGEQSVAHKAGQPVAGKAEQERAKVAQEAARVAKQREQIFASLPFGGTVGTQEGQGGDDSHSQHRQHAEQQPQAARAAANAAAYPAAPRNTAMATGQPQSERPGLHTAAAAPRSYPVDAPQHQDGIKEQQQQQQQQQQGADRQRVVGQATGFQQVPIPGPNKGGHQGLQSLGAGPQASAAQEAARGQSAGTGPQGGASSNTSKNVGNSSSSSSSKAGNSGSTKQQAAAGTRPGAEKQGAGQPGQLSHHPANAHLLAAALKEAGEPDLDKRFTGNMNKRDSPLVPGPYSTEDVKGVPMNPLASAGFASLAVGLSALSLACIILPETVKTLLFPKAALEPGFKAMIMLWGATQLPLAAAALAVKNAIDVDMAGTTPANQLTTAVLLASGLTAFTVFQAVSLRHLPLIGIVGGLGAVGTALSMWVLARVHPWHLPLPDLQGMLLSMLSFVSPHTWQAGVFGALGLLLLGNAALLHRVTPDSANLLVGGSLGSGVAHKAGSIAVFTARAASAGLVAAGGVALVLKEAADKHLLSCPFVVRLALALAMSTGVIAATTITSLLVGMSAPSAGLLGVVLLHTTCALWSAAAALRPTEVQAASRPVGGTDAGEGGRRTPSRQRLEVGTQLGTQEAIAALAAPYDPGF